MILAVDIGNSNIHMGFFSDDSLVCSFNIGTNKDRTSDEYLSLIRSVSSNKNCDITDISGIIIGSVVPSVTEIIKRALAEISDVPIIIVGPGTKTGFSIKIKRPVRTRRGSCRECRSNRFEVFSPSCNSRFRNGDNRLRDRFEFILYRRVYSSRNKNEP